LETGEEVGKIITVVVAGFKEKNLTLWIIIIVGSAAAAASSSYIVIRRRQPSAGEPHIKKKYKGLASLKETIATDFPGNYSVISIELMDRINSVVGLTGSEKALLIEYLNQLDEDDAKAYIDKLTQIQPD
ncbi:MAG TPA: hypothetical protein VMV49_15510, partial [Candidatus Deferrimicrobium sp.]|nr:hypothetical protein [Candidatus Deferrimicrobium sp.]